LALAQYSDEKKMKKTCSLTVNTKVSLIARCHAARFARFPSGLNDVNLYVKFL